MVTMIKRLKKKPSLILKNYVKNRFRYVFDDIVKSFMMEHNDIQSIIFCDFLAFFLSPQVKRYAIITYKYGIYELPHELPNDWGLRILGNWKIPGQCPNSIEWYPRTQSPCQNENFFNARKKLLKNRNLTFPVARYFTWNIELGSDILWMIVDKQMKRNWFSCKFIGSLY